jgi:release factor glutamine methyltransferase
MNEASNTSASGSTTWTVGKVMAFCRSHFEKHQIESPRLFAELILSHVLSIPRINVYADVHRVMADAELAKTRDLVKRACQHEPIQYLTGKAPFFGHEFVVTPDVLIPRGDTETLVEQALLHLKSLAITDSPRVLDLCTGSGCVGLSIARQVKNAQLCLSDLSAKAIEVAKLNATQLKLQDRVQWFVGDLFEPLHQRVDASKFHLITANPPYIPTAHVQQLDANVRDYEPRIALDGGPDGLLFYRRLVADTQKFLTPGGRLVVEIGFDQGDAVTQLFEHSDGWADVKLTHDLHKNPRVVGATARLV